MPKILASTSFRPACAPSLPRSARRFPRSPFSRLTRSPERLQSLESPFRRASPHDPCRNFGPQRRLHALTEPAANRRKVHRLGQSSRVAGGIDLGCLSNEEGAWISAAFNPKNQTTPDKVSSDRSFAWLERHGSR